MREKGFTLMEMVVVLMIIGILTATGIGFYNGFIENSKVIKAKSQIAIMQGAMDSWYVGYGAYPDKQEQELAGLDPEAVDPWGDLFEIEIKSTKTKKSYIIRTGFDRIHQNKVVEGCGENGRSQEPKLVDRV